MDAAARESLEAELRTLCGLGEHDAAATAALRAYGRDILTFLLAAHGNEVDASDAFSAFGEALWRGLPRFAWESTLLTWAYAIARNVSRKHRRDAARRNKRGTPAGPSTLDQVAHAVRTETISFLRTEKRTRLQALRDSLDPEDRMLLVLRVDRGLAWNDLARVFAGAGDATEASAADDASIAREAARLRKRFQIVKDRLREMAKREGIG